MPLVTSDDYGRDEMGSKVSYIIFSVQLQYPEFDWPKKKFVILKKSLRVNELDISVKLHLLRYIPITKNICLTTKLPII